MDLGLLTFNDDGSISFALGDTPRRVTGLESLIQQVLIELLSDPFRGRGSGLAYIVNNAMPGQDSLTKTQIIESVRMAETHIQAFQRNRNILPDELLQSLKATRVETSDGLEWAIDLSITNVSGDTTVQSLSV